MPANNYIDDLIAGRYIDRRTGKSVRTAIRRIEIERGLVASAADLVGSLQLGKRLAVVSDEVTHDVLGDRVASALASVAAVDSIVLQQPHADSATVDDVRQRSRNAEALVAVGSGTINDLCKYATFLDGRDYLVFSSAASMNGYTSSTASITVEGFKTSRPAQVPVGIFMDLDIIATAPLRLSRSGLGDSLCRSSAQVDWLLSHRLLGTDYHSGPFELQADDEKPMLDQASGLASGDLDFYRRLCRVLTLGGLGACITGTSHHASMAEHMVSHYIDMFAGERHPGSLHGEQVGVATLSITRLQRQILMADAPPVLGPTAVDDEALIARYGAERGALCSGELRAKALDQAKADRLNQILANCWSELSAELRELMLPLQRLLQVADDAGLAQRAGELQLPSGFYRQALTHARETRSRYTILDVAGDSDLLDDFVAGEF